MSTHKKVGAVYLVVGLIFLSFNYTFAEQDTVASTDSVEVMNVKAELIKYNKHSSPSRWVGDTHIILKTNAVSFRVIEPSKYAGKEIDIEGFKEAELETYWKFESKKGAYYSFNIPNDFFSGGHNVIYRKLVRNLKEIPK
ncbi:MAG: hypothetical protein Q8O01_01415 [Candidatus Omnitrophota bacterium]|nr:hypothetical protein [Candidatus Omnitrophota bacterium]